MESWQKDIIKAQSEQVDSLFKSISGEIHGYGDIEKARSGVYENTPENRKKGRVGQKYGSKKVEEKKPETKKEEHKGEPLTYKLSEDHEYYVRFSDHIEEDLKRGWSSWNFGEGGIKGTREEIENMKSEAVKEDKPLTVSGMELWGKDIVNTDIRELHDGYWVLVDNTNARGGLSSHKVKNDDLDKMDNLSDLLGYIKNKGSEFDGTGDGQVFNAEDARLVYSKVNMHILEVE